MYHDRTAWRCAFLWAKNMDAAKDMHKEMLPAPDDGRENVRNTLSCKQTSG
jgi:hypothetical protein